MILYQSVLHVQKLLSKRHNLIRQLRSCSSGEIEKLRKEIALVDKELKGIGAQVRI
ncbi:hypothetical protein EMIT07CA2_550052 [Brevibacillus sp. IT-7CA2]